MLTCYIIDDETHCINTLAAYVEKLPDLKLLGTFTNPLEALEKISGPIKPDITFLDVDMPQLSGVELASLIGDQTRVIFTTAFPDYAVEAFDRAATDFLLKPISFERFLKSVSRVKKLCEVQKESDPKDHFYVKSNIKGKVTRINFDQIDYVESIKNYVKIHTAHEDVVTYLTMKELEEVLPPHYFFRVHKSFFVNSSKIKTVNGAMIVLYNNKTIPMGTAYKSAIMDYVNKNLVVSSRGL